MSTDLYKKLNTDYMQFDAYSMKDLITKFLSEDETFTDQVYEGSNLSVLIDLVSQHFQTLMYYLNHSASESMFSDSVIYENMNRLVKILNYSPIGFTTSSLNVSLNNIHSDDDNTVIPEYTSIRTGLVDKRGEDIYFSTVNEHYIFDDVDNKQNNLNAITMFNGRWKLYERTMLAEGVPYESFILSNIISDSTIDEYVSYPYIHVWVKRQTGSGTGVNWIKYIPSTGGLLMNGDSNTPFKSTDTYFDLRLNESKQYEITFGDGIHGQPLRRSDELYIVYLTSNGPDGEITSNVLSDTVGMVTSVVGLNESVLNEWHQFSPPTHLSTIKMTNVTSSSSIKVEETTDEIRDNAPQWFKSQGRLITRQDFTHFIKSRFSNDVIDVVTMNNWDYLSTFYAWLYNLGVEKFGDGRKYLSPELSVKYDFIWSDSCDSNNIYIWVKMKQDVLLRGNTKTQMDNSMRDIKVLTSEPVLVEALRTRFSPCSYIPDDEYDTNNWDVDNDNYIEVYVDSNNLISIETIKTTVNRIIVDYFREQNQKIGSIINMNDLYTNLSSIRGVKRIRTVYEKDNVVRATDGLKFAYWTDTIVDGADLNLSNGTIQLEKFKFPELHQPSQLIKRIKVITDSIYQNTSIEY